MSEIASSGGAVGLLKVIDGQLKNVHTQSLDISFNELADMVSEKELDISPDYQRLFQWSEGARSRFIESLLLEMPVPPIYMVEEDDGTKLLIDGLQRLSSYLHFRGMLTAAHLVPPVSPGMHLTLQECDIVPELNGKTFNDLGTALQIKLKRSFVRVEVVRKGSDPHFKYHMFKRLNTGGSELTHQQVRNCTIRLLNATFIDYINQLSEQSDSFKICTSSLSEEQMLGAYDKELVLRFFALKNAKANFRHDVADFLTEYTERVSDPASSGTNFDYEGERVIFERTFDLLNRTLGENAFSRANKTLNKLVAGFGVYHYEAFTIGLQPFLANINQLNPNHIALLKSAIEEIKFSPEFVRLTTGGGKNSPGPLNDRIAFVEGRLATLEFK